MGPKAVIRQRCRETKERTRVSWKSSGRGDVSKMGPSLIVFLVDRLGDVLPRYASCLPAGRC
jgi:hypothetical protein